MILVDTGPLVALSDPADGSHERCVEALAAINEPIATTVPVLTEAFHLLGPASVGAQRLMDFIADDGLRVLHMDDSVLNHAFELMEKYADKPMDLADASLVAVAEQLDLQTVFTLDRTDFSIYRIKRGHRFEAFHVIG